MSDTASDDVLQRICAMTREEVARRKTMTSLESLYRLAAAASPPRGFAAALSQSVNEGRWALIAEIKKASPSKGLIRADFDPSALALAYRDGGATCLSVLTDGPWFQGTDAYLQAARDAVPLPVLRKDFMLDPWQIVESRVLGADCVLLIMAALDDGEASTLHQTATDLGMDVLIEVHDEAEMIRALQLPSGLLGVNNRSLRTLTVDLAVTERLSSMVPVDRNLVAESGIATPADLHRLAKAGARRFLIGESLMRQADVQQATAALLAEPPIVSLMELT